MLGECVEEVGWFAQQDGLLPDRWRGSLNCGILQRGNQRTFSCTVEVRGQSKERGNLVSTRWPEVQCPLDEQSTLRMANDENGVVSCLLVQLVDLVDDVFSLELDVTQTAFRQNRVATIVSLCFVCWKQPLCVCFVAVFSRACGLCEVMSFTSEIGLHRAGASSLTCNVENVLLGTLGNSIRTNERDGIQLRLRQSVGKLLISGDPIGVPALRNREWVRRYDGNESGNGSGDLELHDGSEGGGTKWRGWKTQKNGMCSTQSASI